MPATAICYHAKRHLLCNLRTNNSSTRNGAKKPRKTTKQLATATINQWSKCIRINSSAFKKSVAMYLLGNWQLLQRRDDSLISFAMCINEAAVHARFFLSRYSQFESAKKRVYFEFCPYFPANSDTKMLKCVFVSITLEILHLVIIVVCIYSVSTAYCARANYVHLDNKVALAFICFNMFNIYFQNRRVPDLYDSVQWEQLTQHKVSAEKR